MYINPDEIIITVSRRHSINLNFIFKIEIHCWPAACLFSFHCHHSISSLYIPKWNFFTFHSKINIITVIVILAPAPAWNKITFQFEIHFLSCGCMKLLHYWKSKVMKSNYYNIITVSRRHSINLNFIFKIEIHCWHACSWNNLLVLEVLTIPCYELS